MLPPCVLGALFEFWPYFTKVRFYSEVLNAGLLHVVEYVYSMKLGLNLNKGYCILWDKSKTLKYIFHCIFLYVVDTDSFINQLVKKTIISFINSSPSNHFTNSAHTFPSCCLKLMNNVKMQSTLTAIHLNWNKHNKNSKWKYGNNLISCEIHEYNNSLLSKTEVTNLFEIVSYLSKME